MSELPARCSSASRERGDELAGTASMVRRFLLVEHPGPWGISALRDAPMPDPVRVHLQVPGTRTLLIRRHRRSATGGVQVFIADVPVRRLRGVVLPELSDLLDLDLADAEVSWGDEHPAGFLGVCTHGRHDACCAERGRPLAATLAALVPEALWEVSHLGGDRFAGNVVWLPEGIYLGRVEPADAAELVTAWRERRIPLHRMRGRTDLPMAAQYAEHALRRRLGLDGVDQVRFAGPEDGGWAFEALGCRHLLTVRESANGAALLTCRAAAPAPLPRFEVIEETLR